MVFYSLSMFNVKMDPYAQLTIILACVKLFHPSIQNFFHYLCLYIQFNLTRNRQQSNYCVCSKGWLLLSVPAFLRSWQFKLEVIIEENSILT